MNAALLYRFIWKEGRLLWPLNLTLLLGGLLIGLLFAGNAPLKADYQILGLALASTLLLLALVNGALTFAPENDQQTLRFLRTLPLEPSQLAMIKLAAAALPVLVAFAGLILFGGSFLHLGLDWLFRDSYPVQGADRSVYFLPHLVLLGLAAFALGGFCSLLLRQSVLALCVAMLALLALNGLFGLVPIQDPGAWFHWSRLGGLLGLSLGLLAATVYLLSPGWLRDQPLRVPAFAVRQPDSTLRSREPIALGRQFGRLLWQTLRLNGSMLLAGLALPLALFLAGTVIGEGFILATFNWLPPLLFAAMASTAFGNDQRLGRYRFFHQHPGSARSLWVARVLPWLAVAMFVGVVVQITIQTIFASDLLQRTDPIYLPGYEERWLLGLFLQSPSAGLLMFGLAAAVGAFCSLAFRSSIVACLAAISTQAGLVFAADYLTWLGGNLIWCLAPLAIGLLWAGWWLAPRWLDQRVTWASRLGVATGLLVAGCCSIGLLAAWRANEINSLIVPTGLMISKFQVGPPSPNQPATGETVTAVRATESIRHQAKQIDTARELVTFLAPLRAQSQDWSAWQLWGRFFGVDFNPLSLEDSDFKLQILITSDLHERISRGELDAARENLRQLLWLDALYAPFPRGAYGFEHVGEAINVWAVAPGQTPQLLQSFLSELQNGYLLRPTLSSVCAHRIAAELSQLWGFPSSAESQAAAFRPGAVWRYQLGLAFPWERIRSAELIKRQAEFLRNDFGYLYREYANNPARPENFYIGRHDRFLKQTTRLGYTSPVAFNLTGELSQLISDLQIRNWLMLRLALLAYHLEHGSYPESLQALSVYFGSDQPKLLPGLSGEFVYLPRGSEFYLVWNAQPNEEPPVIVPHTPVLLPIRSLDLRPTGQVTEFSPPNESTTPLGTGNYKRLKSSWADFGTNDDTLLTDRSAANAIAPLHDELNLATSSFGGIRSSREKHLEELIDLVWLPTQGLPAPSKSADK